MLLAMLLTVGLSFGQVKMDLLKKINGIEIFYKKTKVKELKKKDKWIIELEYTNNTNEDIYYKTVTQNNNNLLNALAGGSDKIEVYYFATVHLQNAKTMSFVSDQKVRISGDKTRLVTDENHNLFLFKKGKTYTETLDFKSEKGVEPVLTVDIVNSITFTEDITDFL